MQINVSPVDGMSFSFHKYEHIPAKCKFSLALAFGLESYANRLETRISLTLTYREIQEFMRERLNRQ